ncbi:hypothetical protein [Egbenema bharatensis]|uniref:hypothetical protein n=1 Tax=Egbenema bharatensis TaxID=3463334 RepID=UPI003A8595FF
MTSRTLMPNFVSESPRVNADCLEQGSTQSVQVSAPDSANLIKLNKLPYQANHKAELIHLQEDIDALLQQLQTLKQQRLASVPSSLDTSADLPVLV